MENVKGKKVFVGLSGGVDSAVSAALLKEAGALVTGVFIKGWYPPGMPCTWSADRRDAMRVAARLHIPFVTLDASQEYKDGVIDYLLREYKAGRTPNPDIMCNREVKFGAFYRFAKEVGADFIATGHYARRKELSLLRGVDESKDQSYFLWAIPNEALVKTLFPVGELEKTEVRKLAQKYMLPNAVKRDSQGICFLGNISVEDFLRQEFGSEPGMAVDTSGKEVGKHGGALLYTLGERIPLEGTLPGPWYVIQKNIQTNTITVSHERMSATTRKEIHLTDTHWFKDIEHDTELVAQYRYHGPRVVGTLSRDRTTFVPSDTLQETIAEGQSLVLYTGEECIGGGIIS